MRRKPVLARADNQTAVTSADRGTDRSPVLIHLARRLRDLEFSGILRIRGRGDVAAGASLRFTAEVRWPGPRFGLFLGIKSRRGAVVGWGGMGNDVLASDD